MCWRLPDATASRLPADAITGANWTLTDSAIRRRVCERWKRRACRSGEYVKGQIFYGVKTGFNTAFVINAAQRAELIAQDPKSAEIIKPLAVGDDVRRWRIDEGQSGSFIISAGRGIDTVPCRIKSICPMEDANSEEDGE